MRETTIARNYSETLIALAGKANDLAGWGTMIMGVSDAMAQNRMLRLFLESPRVSADEKNKLLAAAFTKTAPRNFLRFLQSLVTNRRQMLIPAIATEYMNLLDEAEGRVHARVTVARETPDAEKAQIAAELSRVFGKQVLPHITVDPSIMGGIIVHIGDTVLDGSVKKRLATLKRRMMVSA